jgi:hypothetical protein
VRYGKAVSHLIVLLNGQNMAGAFSLFNSCIGSAAFESLLNAHFTIKSCKNTKFSFKILIIHEFFGNLNACFSEIVYLNGLGRRLISVSNTGDDRDASGKARKCLA